MWKSRRQASRPDNRSWNTHDNRDHFAGISTTVASIGLLFTNGKDRGENHVEGEGPRRPSSFSMCGLAGIAGQKGAMRCLVEGNLIEDTNYRREFGGWETAAIEFHQSVENRK
jgi:alpha-N-arabinofuranosidase